MPLAEDSYVVWKAKPVEWDTSEARTRPGNGIRRWTPHCDLSFTDNNGRHVTNINVRSSDTTDHRLVFWTGDLTRGTPFGDRIIGALESDRFNDLGYYNNPPPLDFLHDGFLDVRTCTIRDTNVDGPNNDITDALDKFVNASSDEFQHSTVFIWGEFYSGRGGGIHQVHMNQGNYERNPQWYAENGRGQDGGIVIEWPDSGKYSYFFIAFAGQASNTDEQGNPESGNDTEMLRDYIGAPPPVINTTPVVPGRPNTVKIHSALVNPVGADNTPGNHDRVRIVNRTADPISLDGWTIQNQDGRLKQLPDVLLPGEGAMVDLDVGPEAYLANRRDGKIVLKDAGGTEVDRVSYRAADVSEGEWISFPGL